MGQLQDTLQEYRTPYRSTGYSRGIHHTLQEYRIPYRPGVPALAGSAGIPVQCHWSQGKLQFYPGKSSCSLDAGGDSLEVAPAGSWPLYLKEEMPLTLSGPIIWGFWGVGSSFSDGGRPKFKVWL